MNMKIVIHSITLLLAGTFSTAQADFQKAQAHQGQVKAAGATRVETAVQLEFGVIGLTQVNLEEVQKGLTALKTQVYVCAGCQHEQAMAGTCAPCKLELEARSEPMLLEVVPSVTDGRIRLIPVATRALRFSDLEGALTKSAIKIDAARFPLAGKSRLVLRGGTLENADAIEKALLDAKLFDKVDATFDAASGEIRIAVQASATAPMHDKVTAAIDALGTKAKLTDVIWGAPAPVTKA